MTPTDEIRQAAESVRPDAPYANNHPPKWFVSLRIHVGGEVFEILESTYHAIENGRCTADRLGPVLHLARRINEAS